jgi:hypothetical protein
LIGSCASSAVAARVPASWTSADAAATGLVTVRDTVLRSGLVDTRTGTGVVEAAAEVLAAPEFDGAATFEDKVVIDSELDVVVTLAAPEVAEAEVVTAADGAAVLQPARTTPAPNSSAAKVEVRISSAAFGRRSEKVCPHRRGPIGGYAPICFPFRVTFGGTHGHRSGDAPERQQILGSDVAERSIEGAQISP